MEFKDFSLFINQTKVGRFASDLAAGRIMSTLCKRCGRRFYPPQADCPSCMESEMEWREIGAEGRLLTFTRIHVPPEHFAVRQPLMPFSSVQFEPCPIGLLQVENGLTLMGWIPKVDVKKLRVGMKMKASPFTLPDGKVTIVLEPLEA
ncbi:MAG: Zn-ribbon domain-containing OB-fold protein [Desulfobacterota bacterium]|nr:Zn-ribbon domain-containing OB-fold protein [Thermodesulfobacteriota bacterium]